MLLVNLDRQVPGNALLSGWAPSCGFEFFWGTEKHSDNGVERTEKKERVLETKNDGQKT